MSKRKSRWATILLVLLFLATCVLVWLAQRHIDAASEAAGASARAAAGATGGARGSAAPTRTAVFVGDGYTEAGGGNTGWAFEVANARNWRPSVVAERGQGFTTVPQACRTEPCTDLAGQIPLVSELEPDVVMVLAGAVDGKAASSPVIRKYFTELRASLPDAEIYVISPLATQAKSPAWIAVTGKALHASANAIDATYLDIGQPLAGKPELVSGTEDLTAAGHQAVADAVLAKLG